MTSTLAYEIGAVFLLAALLMYGTVSGFIQRNSEAGKALAIVLGVAVLAFAVYHFGPDLYADWRSIGTVAPRLTTSQPAPVVPTPAPLAKKPASRQAAATKEPEARWKTIILDDSVPESANQVAPLKGKSNDGEADTKSAATADRETGDAPPNLAFVEEDHETKAGTESSGSSPFDSGATRAIKSIGHFLHIGHRKYRPAQTAQQP